MSNDNDRTDFPDNTDEAKGRAKQAVGNLTGDEQMEREGRQDEAKGNVKQAIDDLGDKAKKFVDDVTGNSKR